MVKQLNMKRPKLKNHNDDKFLQENGFIVIHDFLSEKQLKSADSIKENLMLKHTTLDPVFWNSLWNVPEIEFERSSDDLLGLMKGNLDERLKDYEVPQVSIMVKLPGEHTACYPHRDFSILNEETNQYWNAWCPLIDIDDKIGPLYALRASHIKLNHILAFNEKWPYIDYYKEVEKLSEHFKIKKGDLIIYCDRTVHGSIPNRTKRTRGNLHFGILPLNADYKYYKKKEEQILVYDVDLSFYTQRKFKEYFEEKEDYKIDINIPKFDSRDEFLNTFK